MPVFIWEAETRDGQLRKGELEAPNKDVAAAMLRRQGLANIKKLKKKPKEIEIFPEKPTEKDITIFFRQLATMLNAGIPLVQAFALGEQGAEKKAMRELLGAVRKDLEEGNPLADSLAKHPEYFDRLTVALVRAGEQGGILDTILARLCAYKEKALALKGKIKSAMVYPVSIIVVAFVVTAILMIFVIPQFAEMFKDFGAELPGPTKITIAISNKFVEYWYVVLAAPFVIFFSIRAIYNTPAGRWQLDKLLLNLPVLGDVLRKAAVARFCRTFATLLGAGVAILEAIDTVAETAGNVVVEKAILDAKGAIQEGRTLTEPLEASGIFPVMVTQMIRIGEESGALEEMLSKIADFYEEEVDAAVDAMTSLMEPFIMAFLGVVIGGLVISMYLPIFQMASVVGG